MGSGILVPRLSFPEDGGEGATDAEVLVLEMEIDFSSYPIRSLPVAARFVP
jgi:hypothetical protein